MLNVVITKKSRLNISAQFDLYGPICSFGCPNGDGWIEIIINGATLPYQLLTTVGCKTAISAVISNFIHDVDPGNYRIEFRGNFDNRGSSFRMEPRQSSVMVIPLE